MLRLTCICVLITYALSTYVQQVVVKIAGNPGVNGTVNFTQTGDQVLVQGRISGLTPGLHGFHIHQYGDISGVGCLLAGPHFNPYNETHGGLNSTEHHAGDFGNVRANSRGIAVFSFNDTSITLRRGKTNIIGRAAVIHANPDDLGTGSNNESSVNGNSGARIGCGVIGISREMACPTKIVD